MPAKCHWCETNTHDDRDKEECVRRFLTPQEAWEIIGAKDKSEDIHVICNPKENILIGADWSREAVKEMVLNCRSVELTEADGHARRMKHGLAIIDSKGEGWFVETDEDALKAWEKIYA